MWAVPDPRAFAHSNSKVYPMILVGGPEMNTSSFQNIRLLMKLCFNAFFAYVKLFESKRKQTSPFEVTILVNLLGHVVILGYNFVEILKVL